MKQFRVVYQLRRALLRGAGAAFVIAVDEEKARELVAASMPGAEIIELKEEQDDPRRAYERPPLELLQGGKPEAPPCTTCGGSGTFPGFAPGTFPCPTCHRNAALAHSIAVLKGGVA